MQLQNTKAPSALALNAYLLHSMIFMFTILFYVLYAAAAAAVVMLRRRLTFDSTARRALWLAK